MASKTSVPPGERDIDAQVLESCRRGDREAFRALYNAWKDKVYSISFYYFHGDAEEAADVTQEVFLKLMTGIGTFRGSSGFATWLYRLVSNACTDGARSRAARSRVIDRAAVCRPDNESSQEYDLLRAQAAMAVQTAVSALPPKLRLPILLRYFEDFSYEEIADALNCSAGTVASRLNRGHRLLAEKLAPQRDLLGIEGTA
jgi:RNA polymerase sigma-70 factor (ECF subfamily)